MWEIAVKYLTIGARSWQTAAHTAEKTNRKRRRAGRPTRRNRRYFVTQGGRRSGRFRGSPPGLLHFTSPDVQRPLKLSFVLGLRGFGDSIYTLLKDSSCRGGIAVIFFSHHKRGHFQCSQQFRCGSDKPSIGFGLSIGPIDVTDDPARIRLNGNLRIRRLPVDVPRSRSNCR